MNALAQPRPAYVAELPATLDAEWDFLLAACSTIPPHEQLIRLRRLLQQPLRWKAIFELADQHGVQPLLYQSLSGIENEIPPEALRSLKQAFQTNLHKAMLLSRELIRIVASLSAQGIEVLPYKGPAVAEIAYGDLALRQSGDIDLLIRPADFARAREAARNLGYRPHLKLSPAEERAYLRSGYECSFDGEAGPNLLELQWAIQPRFYAVDFDMTALFERAVTVPVAGRPIKTLCPEDLLLVLCVHAAKHAWGRLVWLCDIARLMKTDLNWAEIGQRARRLGIIRIVRVAMLASGQLLGAAIPLEADKNLRADTASAGLARQVAARIRNAGSENTESIAYFRQMLALRERRTDQIRFLQRLLFTPGPNEWNTVRLPAALFPFYRTVRLYRVAKRLLHS